MPEHRLCLIDTFALIFRAYYANMRIKNGAANTMPRMLLNIVAQHRPTHLACVFDRPEPTFRHQIYPAYKANRAPMPEDLRPQIPLIRQLIEALNIPIVELAGFEADDVMGTLARQAAFRVGRIGVGQAEGEDEPAVRVLPADDVTPLGRRPVSLFRLRRDRIVAEGGGEDCCRGRRDTSSEGCDPNRREATVAPCARRSGAPGSSPAVPVSGQAARPPGRLGAGRRDPQRFSSSTPALALPRRPGPCAASRAAAPRALARAPRTSPARSPP